MYIIELSDDRLEGIHPLVTPAYVLAASAVFNFVRCLVSGQPLFTSDATQFGYMLLLAVVCAFIAILCYCVGVRLIGPSNASIINTFEPACACVFGYFLIGDQITLSMIIGGGLIIVAVLLTSLPDKKGAVSGEYTEGGITSSDSGGHLGQLFHLSENGYGLYRPADVHFFQVRNRSGSYDSCYEGF